MNRLRLARIIACFLLTFLLGGMAGWKLRPVPAASGPAAGTLPPSQRLMENLDAHLHLSPEQKAALRPIAEEWGRRVDGLGRQPRRRRELFEQFNPRIRALLNSQQTAEYDQMVAEARARFARRLGERALPGGDSR
jgi:hypothetical protein